MLTLYSFGPGANSLKPMATLYEKAIRTSRSATIDPAKFEQHSDWFRRSIPAGRVPALRVDGKVVTRNRP